MESPIHFLFFAGPPPDSHQTPLHPTCRIEEATSHPLEREESSQPPPTRFHQGATQRTCPTACVLWAPGLALLKDIQAGSATLAADFQPLCCSVQTSPLFTACGHCYVIKTWVLMAAMITDILLTLLITASVFCLMTKLKRRRDPDTLKLKI
ncbi:hypothetical protein D4764_10G0003880 [Takifugu flavidus]|uniref:DNAX-activation protein 10 n=1 Tax=Takifugu flavidus TaxID=433684 RepID=A0A5C6PKU6_9TELE|nr:hypothetical protein D4764_10G0003880 [Takifugu flavidus]